MKKHQSIASAILFTIALFCSGTLSAQWSQSTTAIYPTTLTKNVGIGTSTPTKRLQVAGGLRVDNEVSVGGTGLFEVDATGVTGGRFKIAANGNVGIGNNNPTSAKLQFANALGNKITLFDNGGNNNAYGFGVNDYSLGAYVPTGSRFSVRVGAYNGAEKFIVNSDGYIGAGTTAPTAHLDIVGGPCWTSDCWKKAVQIENAAAVSFRVSPTLSYGIGATSAGESNLFFYTSSDGTANPPAHRMVLTQNGKVGIGVAYSSQMPGNYKLYVADGILTEKVKVALKSTGDWADYVFANDYKLRSLSDVESYVKENKHLPGVPSAEEVQKTGIDMATMDSKLLEKIEELTLYMIELKKDNDALRQEVENLKHK